MVAGSCTNEYQGCPLPSNNYRALPWWLVTVVNDTNPKEAYRRKPWIFVWWFLVRLLFFHCVPAGRHSDSTPDSRCVRLCSRLPCGSYGAGSPTAVVCSRELVSCGNGGTLCRSGVDIRGHVSSVCTLDHFTCAPSSYRAISGGKA